jgi:hypothetical protein
VRKHLPDDDTTVVTHPSDVHTLPQDHPTRNQVVVRQQVQVFACGRYPLERIPVGAAQNLNLK